MLKKILLAAVVAATATFAQINVGATLGANLSTLKGDDSEDFGTSIGFQAGVAGKFAVPVIPLVLVPEILTDMRNFSYDPGAEYNITTWALDIPVMARFSPMPVFYIEAGPQFAFNLSTSSDKVLGKDISDIFEFNTFEFDFVLGGGTDILPFVDIDFRVVLGLSDWMSGLVGEKGGDPWDTSNLQFMLGVTYWFL